MKCRSKIFNTLFVVLMGMSFIISNPVIAQPGVFPSEVERGSLLTPPETSRLEKEMVDLPTVAGVRAILKPERPIFRLGSDIVLLLEIKNSSETRESFRFNFDENSFLQISVDVVDGEGQAPFTTAYFETAKYLLENSELGENIPLTASESRNILLTYQQSFTTTFKLNDYYDFEKNGTYFVKLKFYPLNKKYANYFIESSEMQFQISELKTGNVLQIDEYQKAQANNIFFADVGREKSKVEENTQQYVFALDPQSVVQKNLMDQQKKRWLDFLQGFNLRRLLQNSYSSTDYFERYLGALENEKPIVLDDFSQFLVDSIDYEVTGFNFLKTTIIGNKAKVEVLLSSVESYVSKVEFFNHLTGQVESEWLDLQGDTLERKRKFIYDLQNIDGEWKIISIDTRVVEDPTLETATFEEEKSDLRGEKVEKLGFIYFENNLSQLQSQYFLILDKLVEILEEDASLRLLLIGYADERGSEDYNLRLSAARVNAVRAYLLENGILNERMNVDARGEIKGTGNGDTKSEEDRLSENRRVEIYLSR